MQVLLKGGYYWRAAFISCLIVISCREVESNVEIERMVERMILNCVWVQW